MSYKIDVARCIGCGACDFTCPTGALEKTDSFLGLFDINPFTCDDCAKCVDKCPEAAIAPEPNSPTCKGHGCPIGSRRLEGFGCTIWQERCTQCGTTMWIRPDGTHHCPRCDLAMKVVCPKTRRLTLEQSPASRGFSGPLDLSALG